MRPMAVGKIVLAGTLVATMSGLMSHSVLATPKSDARDACVKAMQEQYGATRITVTNIGSKRGTRRIVYGEMDQGGRRGLRFRCWVRSRQFDKLEFRGTSNTDWVPARRVRVERDDTDEEPEAPKTGEQGRLTPAEPQRFKVDWGESYSPEEGVTCYKKRAACFDGDEKLLIEWTRKEFPQS